MCPVGKLSVLGQVNLCLTLTQSCQHPPCTSCNNTCIHHHMKAITWIRMTPGVGWVAREVGMVHNRILLFVGWICINGQFHNIIQRNSYSVLWYSNRQWKVSNNKHFWIRTITYWNNLFSLNALQYCIPAYTYLLNKNATNINFTDRRRNPYSPVWIPHLQKSRFSGKPLPPTNCPITCTSAISQTNCKHIY